MHGCFGGWMSPVLMLLVLAAVLYLILRGPAFKAKRSDSSDSLEILKRRLAMGEISVDEFNNLKKYL